MQDGWGGGFTDRNGVAQLSSIAMATNLRPHSFHRTSFTSQVPTTARRTDVSDGFAFARHRRVRSNPHQAGIAHYHDFQNMQFDCLCVCHSRFQNEVIGG